jgi:hypothetical protein
MLKRNQRRELRPRIKEKYMINEFYQAGSAHITPKDRVESPDCMKVKLLVGGDHGSVGEIVILSYQPALAAIAAGRAVAV